MYPPLRSAPWMGNSMFQEQRNKECLPARKDTFLMHTVPTKLIAKQPVFLPRTRMCTSIQRKGPKWGWKQREGLGKMHVRPTCFVQKYHACALCLANMILRKRPTVIAVQWIDKQSKKVKVAKTYLYASWLCFLIISFSRKNLTDFYDLWHPYNKEWWNFTKMLFNFL